MFPADCLPSNYVEARAQKERELAATASTTKSSSLLQPTPQRPNMSRTLSSAFMSFFPTSTSNVTSPSTTPMPSPGLQQSAKMGWFGPLPAKNAGGEDIACLPPAWS